MVAAIDQLILLLSISAMQNLERTIREFEPESTLIIISYLLKHIEKRRTDYRLHALPATEKQFCAGKVECDIPEFIEDQKIDLLELPKIKGEPVLVSRLDHLIDQTCCRTKRYPIVLLTGEYSDCNRHMRLTCSRISDENDIPSFREEREGFQCGKARLWRTSRNALLAEAKAF